MPSPIEAFMMFSPRLASLARAYTGTDGVHSGLPGQVPAPPITSNTQALLNVGNWTTVSAVAIDKDSMTVWQTGTDYNTIGVFLAADGYLLRVEQVHTAGATWSADMLAGKLSMQAGQDNITGAWTAATIYSKDQIVTFNGQLIQSQGVFNSSATFAADCSLGRWKFISNVTVSAVTTGTGYYAFQGQVVVRSGQIYACIVSHANTGWVPANWSALVPIMVSPTGSTNGAAGLVPGATIAQLNWIFTTAGWTDPASIGVGGGGSLSKFNVDATPVTTGGALAASRLGKLVPVDSTAGAMSISLPTPGVNDPNFIILADVASTWSVKPVTVTAIKVSSVTDDWLLNASKFVVMFIYALCCQAYSDFKWYVYGKDGVDDEETDSDN